MRYFQEARKNVKNLPKAIWFAALVLPFGLVGVTTYLAFKSYSDSKKKENKNEG